MGKLNKTLRVLAIVAALVVLMSAFNQAAAQGNADATKNYFTVEGYYKVKWGFADEFIGLWKKNHYPLLKKAIEHGYIISVTAEKPRLHSGEDTRWDFRVTLVFKTAALAYDENLTTPYKAQLYPDLDKLAKEEQHRFELLISHWDITSENVSLD